MTPGAGVLVLGNGHISENAIFLLLLFTLGHGSDKLSICVVMMTKERSTKIMFHNPRGCGSYARAWSYKSL